MHGRSARARAIAGAIRSTAVRRGPAGAPHRPAHRHAPTSPARHGLLSSTIGRSAARARRQAARASSQTTRSSLAKRCGNSRSRRASSSGAARSTRASRASSRSSLMTIQGSPKSALSSKSFGYGRWRVGSGRDRWGAGVRCDRDRRAATRRRWRARARLGWRRVHAQTLSPLLRGLVEHRQRGTRGVRGDATVAEGRERLPTLDQCVRA